MTLPGSGQKGEDFSNRNHLRKHDESSENPAEENNSEFSQCEIPSPFNEKESQKQPAAECSDRLTGEDLKSKRKRQHSGICDVRFMQQQSTRIDDPRDPGDRCYGIIDAKFRENIAASTPPDCSYPCDFRFPIAGSEQEKKTEHT